MAIEKSKAPFGPEPSQGFIATCDNGHEMRVYLDGFTREMAIDYCQILDGTSSMYVVDPRADPRSFIGHCAMPNCGALFSARPFGFDQN